ncbi:Oxidoreductase FAD binding domain [Trypanosoma vivax]|uniref:NADH-cytochrome b5 reductase-like protein n=1 Tax=Trypanosoma vivax (strain Y486) TaxID=1055687 RepID=G0UBP5_TRYVY|nr:Oxidoreductase FAD binding domain [Trypanosoma vivax]CCC53242.1 NADH-cytochrome b5 reductase-like protein [Trypanosoma vivax Y486]
MVANGNGAGIGSSSGSTTFSDCRHHRGAERRKLPQQEAPRWSFELQDIPARLRRFFFDVNFGYAARVSVAFGVTFGASCALYQLLFVHLQDGRPLAQRSRFAPHVPVTLLEKERVGNTEMIVYRFALPNSYDYCGYEPVSSVQVTTDTVRSMAPVTRWFTPISLPHERGIVEFAIKERDPGRMAARLRSLERGERVYLGRWMREFPYTKSTFTEIGLVCTTSGASIALQLMKLLDADKKDNTRLRFLYCHHTAKDIPFRDVFENLARRSCGRISVAYNVMTRGQPSTDTSACPGENVFLGHIDPSMVEKVLPPPFTVDKETGTITRPKILVCGPQRMLMHLCGRVSMLGSYSYWQGPFYKYCGFLKDMGYTRSQVYKFGVSSHPFAYQ